jgi:2-dehydro-3-deoxy-L-rhamnonate dehydrogenase (NAD+)
VVEVNLLGTFYCCRAIVPVMLQGGYGRIINIASIAGKEGNPQASAYSASKAGVIGLTKSLGKELARHGILVNCLTPAAVETDLFQQMTPEHIQASITAPATCGHPAWGKGSPNSQFFRG